MGASASAGLEWGTWWHHKSINFSWMSFLVIGCLSLLCGFFGLFLLETDRRALPDMVQGAERGRKQDDIVSDVG